MTDRAYLRHRRALVVVAHPDDETFGLGAVVDQLTSNGVHVDQLCFTRGEASTLGASPDLAERRAVELRAACTALGIHRLNQLPYPDGHLAEVSQEELANYVEAMLDGASVLVVFEAGGITGHPDHQAATAAALLAAAPRPRGVGVGDGPEVASTLRDEFGAAVQRGRRRRVRGSGGGPHAPTRRHRLPRQPVGRQPGVAPPPRVAGQLGATALHAGKL